MTDLNDNAPIFEFSDAQNAKILRNPKKSGISVLKLEIDPESLNAGDQIIQMRARDRDTVWIEI